MSSITLPTQRETDPHLRPLSVLRDLPAVADLIETCFDSTMDRDGRRYIQEMRRAGKDYTFLQWASRAAESTSLPLTGYVWEEDGRVVGNTSLVPFHRRGQKYYLIANVAVHPDFRRRGIARALTERALKHARDRHISQTWLHVRADNPGAIDLYRSLGFVERARRTSWQAPTDPSAAGSAPPAGIMINDRFPRDWETELQWLSDLYPEELAWHRNWSFSPLKPGLFHQLYLLMIDVSVRQWLAVRDGRMEAALAWMPESRGEGLFAAVGKTSDPAALTALLQRARRDLAHDHPRLGLEFPAGLFDNAILAAGFEPQRTLIWMQAT